MKINSYNISRLAIAFIWLYHGLVPKLIFQHTTELELINKGPILQTPEVTLFIAGGLEVIAGLVVILFWQQVWPVYLSLIGFTILLISSAVIAPELAVQAFNPITLTISAMFFCSIQIVENWSTSRSVGS